MTYVQDLKNLQKKIDKHEEDVKNELRRIALTLSGKSFKIVSGKWKGRVTGELDFGRFGTIWHNARWRFTIHCDVSNASCTSFLRDAKDVDLKDIQEIE